MRPWSQIRRAITPPAPTLTLATLNAPVPAVPGIATIPSLGGPVDASATRSGTGSTPDAPRAHRGHGNLLEEDVGKIRGHTVATRRRPCQSAPGLGQVQWARPVVRCAAPRDTRDSRTSIQRTATR